MSPAFEMVGATISRGGFDIVREVNLAADAGEVAVLLGPNGAGKTTLLEGASGVIPVASGSVSVGGMDVTKATRVRRANRGLAHVEQGRAVFSRLTVEENLLTAAPKADHQLAFDMFPSLVARRRVAARHLSGGEQQMLVLARALLTKPQVLLLDEISLGLAPVIVAGLMPVVRSIADTGVAVVLVEQFAKLALDIGDRAFVLQRGSIAYSGTCHDLQAHPELLSGAYLASGT